MIQNLSRDRTHLTARLSISPLPPCMRLSPHTAIAYQDIYPRFLSADIGEDSHAFTFGISVL
jgi:hypothetical protein